MSECTRTTKCRRRWHSVLSGVAAVAGLGVVAINLASAGDDPPDKNVLMHGAELFAREWLPGDSKGSGGDGLGPVYNETSCFACHHQGGPGGAGPTSTNVEILTAPSFGRDAVKPVDLHPGFRISQSIVLHRYGVDPEYTRKRLTLLVDDRLAQMAESVETEIAQVQAVIGLGSTGFGRASIRTSRIPNGMVLSQRNPPALFGVGKIDAISEETLVAAEDEQKKFLEFPEIRGRVSRLQNGRLGRFGWKAETPNLREFVLSACANELGLEVPGHHQAASPLEPDATAKGLDLTQTECDALVAYMRDLGAPKGAVASMPRESPAIADGRAMFDSAGCAACHRPSLGDVEGIYSDLLLHDMGPALSDSGSYYGITEPDSSRSKDGVKKQEWRTPPLWGFRDSAPYLHDGRAKNLEEAVALHGGEAKEPAKRFFKLHPNERLRVQAFLRSLSPPAAGTR
jgi:CxxC motif-containing protein (DUF1111 family)